MTLTVGEPLGDVSGSANHDFWTSVTEISGEVDASLPNTPYISTNPLPTVGIRTSPSLNSQFTVQTVPEAEPFFREV